MLPGRAARWTLLALVVAALAVPSSAAAVVSFSRTDIPVTHASAPVAPESIAVADLDGENGNDIAIALPAESSVGVMLNMGNGTFGAMTEYPTGCPDNSVVDITLGDVTNLATGGLNPDGIIDAYVACAPNVVRLRGDGNGGFTMAESFNLFVAQPLGGTTPDMLTLVRRADGNASPLLILQRSGGSDLSRRLCAAPDLTSGGLDCDESTPMGGPLAAGDINGTTAGVPPDEVVTGTAGNTFSVFGYFKPDSGPMAGQVLWSNSPRNVPANPSGPAGIESAAVGDLEPDGDRDVVVGQSVNSLDSRVNAIHYYRWQPAGLETNPTTLASVPGLDAVGIGDIDDDGCNDIVGGGGYGRGIVHLGDGTGSFDSGQQIEQFGFGNDAYTTRVTMVVDDLTGDGLPDVVMNDQASALLMVFRNTSTHDGAACFDDPPQATDDEAFVDQDAGPTAIDVLANDADPDGGPAFGITGVVQPANGDVVTTGGGTGLTYQPDSGYCNTIFTPDTFTYTVTGGSQATVRVYVQCPGDDPPAGVNDSATVLEDSSFTTVDVLANDTDTDGGPKSVVGNGPAANGTVARPPSGANVSYQPNPEYCNEPGAAADDTFTYTLNGGSTATVAVTVTCVDDQPAAGDDAATVAQDSGATAIDVLANDSDVDGGPKLVASATPPARGTVAVTGGGSGLTYQPNAGYCNDPGAEPVDTFTYTLNGGSSATVAVTVTCAPPPPPPGLLPGRCANAVTRGGTLTGTPAGDRLTGSPQGDVISGLAGEDCLSGLAGNDQLSGGSEDDELDGGDGSDTLSGDSGDDDLVGGDNNDRLSGSSGNDAAVGGSGNDRVSGGTGNDRTTGGTGNDILSGDSGNDRLRGSSGRDRLTPGSGRDSVNGDAGNDTIFARDRDRDTIDCGTGRDRVTADRTDRANRNCERVSRR
jgi:Ca2+-binding RTX toxin-like protein